MSRRVNTEGRFVYLPIGLIRRVKHHAIESELLARHSSRKRYVPTSTHRSVSGGYLKRRSDTKSEGTGAVFLTTHNWGQVGQILPSTRLHP
jgi:hypothetical protein